jgi:transcriptional regulator with XRE-family HTH domain
MTDSIINLALKTLGVTQKELAKKMEVSPAQVSKWKAGEHMSVASKDKLSALIGLPSNMDADLVLMAGDVESAAKWTKLIEYLAEDAAAANETSYDTYPLEDELKDLGPEILALSTLRRLKEAGANIPEVFPAELDFDYDANDADIDLIYEHPLSEFIAASYKALTDLYGFYAAYIDGVVIDLSSLSPRHDRFYKIEEGLLSLAVAKTEDRRGVCANHNSFKRRIHDEYRSIIEELKSAAYENSIPLKAELMDLVSRDHDYVGQEAEAKALGFRGARLHPDIYMDELLRGMRVIHQVLPAICNKLGITGEDLDLDTWELTTSGQKGDSAL